VVVELEVKAMEGARQMRLLLVVKVGVMSMEAGDLWDQEGQHTQSCGWERRWADVSGRR
jgi:hypothetical protein